VTAAAPRLEIRLDRLRENVRSLVDRLGRRAIAVTAVTKATLGSPRIARELLAGGAAAIGDSRIENIEAMRRAGVEATMVLIRTPMLSQVDRVVRHADVSLNTELDVIERLASSSRAQRRPHHVVLMVELGDLREGILAEDLGGVVKETLRMGHVTLRGIGANLACQSGVAPDDRNMAELSALARSLESTFGIELRTVSGGNSANLDWALGSSDPGRVNDLRLGEAILLGCEPLRRRPIDGLHADAFTLVAEVIESKVKPTLPWGDIKETAFGRRPPEPDRGPTARTILAVGRQDVDPEGIDGPAGIRILGASSDHLVVDAGSNLSAVGSEVRFRLNYSALLAAMTSPFVEKVFATGD
jgi:predicted amino acid racemase